MANEFRRAVGILLRLPIVIALSLVYYIYIWPFIAGAAIIFIVLHPLIYPLRWVWHAFIGSNDDLYENHFKNYPEDYLKWFKTGYPTLNKWLFEGWA